MTDSSTTPEVTANFDKNVDEKEFKFRFRKDKLGNQRDSVEVTLGVPSVEGIIAILQAGGKQLELLQDACYETVRDALLNYISDNESATSTNVPKDQFTWEAIANQPREDRRSSQISEEVWQAFAKDYIEVMQAVTGKNLDAVTNATTVYLKKFSIVKTDKKVLKILQEQLGLYMETKNAEQYSEVLDVLNRRLDSYLKADDVALLVANL